MNEQKLWLGQHKIVHEDHLPGLEASAAIHELRYKKPRAEAEHEAHKEYTKQMAIEGAGHHLLGMKSAHAAGSMEAAKKHGAAYIRAVEKAGLNPHGPVPKEVKSAAEDIEHSYVHYKKHPTDELFEDSKPHEKDPSEKPKIGDKATEFKPNVKDVENVEKP